MFVIILVRILKVIPPYIAFISYLFLGGGLLIYVFIFDANWLKSKKQKWNWRS